ncbi:ankyrin repeat domain-containing protein 54-like [Pollicipes pollicipes]|uniref:ankyrin repeat domain-containing protein 54-like n=1 Tax=Pollicipes pollicipes TaxID=41117 RepID=UPI0018850961|nr:ankyrin repeat domain-containing protein 54-like [Pollicipes pollicipes]
MVADGAPQPSAMPLQLPYAGDECVHVFRVRCRSSGRTRSLVRWLRHTRNANDNLMRAVRCNNVERLASLVRAGADVNQADETGRTALHLAAQQCSSGMVAALLSLGARPNARDIVECTPLHAALAGQRVRLLSGLWPPDSRPTSASRSIEELREVCGRRSREGMEQRDGTWGGSQEM